MTAKRKFSDLADHQRLGIGAQYKVHSLLRYYGINSEHKGAMHVKYDLLVNGAIRVEVKCSNPHQAPSNNAVTAWSVNFHRHLKMSEDHVDYYVVRLVPIEVMGKRSLHLLFKSPVLVPTMTFTIRSLLGVYARNLCAWERLVTEKKFPDFI